MTTTIDRTFQYQWWVGNARLTDLSARLLGAHIAHAGLIMFWAGSFTLLELTNLDPSRSIAEQGLLVIPNLARLGWGVGEGGIIVDTYPYFVIAMLHLIASAVLGAGGLFHTFKGAGILKNETGFAPNFHYEWSDPKKLGFILGNHLIILGLGALLLVFKAMFFDGIYDSNIEEVRIISNPTLNPGVIFGYIFGFNHGHWNPLGMASVDNLEDVIGGHIWIGMLLVGGGIWHVIKEPFNWVQKRIIFSGDAILSYSLSGVALAALISAYFVAYNNTVFPAEFYSSDRSAFTTTQVALGLTFLGGHIWHAFRGRTNGKVPEQKDYVSAAIAGFAFLFVVSAALALKATI
ncbi:MAG: chlorophyll a/b binding light-harvesting protein [Prochloraceae cyanobacterium]